MLEVAVIFKVWFSPGDPDVTPDKFIVRAGEFSLTTTLFRESKVGGKFGMTVTVKLRTMILLLVPPSLTVTEIMAVPLALPTGLKIKEPVVAGLV